MLHTAENIFVFDCSRAPALILIHIHIAVKLPHRWAKMCVYIYLLHWWTLYCNVFDWMSSHSHSLFLIAPRRQHWAIKINGCKSWWCSIWFYNKRYSYQCLYRLIAIVSMITCNNESHFMIALQPTPKPLKFNRCTGM